MKKVVVFSNPDKDPIKEEHDIKNLSNHIRSSRILITGRPGSGKSNIVKNLICQQQPAFDKIFILTPDLTSKEYHQLNAEVVDSYVNLPDLKDCDPDEKTLLIFEDYEFNNLNIKEMNLLDAYLRYGCTHKGMTIYLCCQNYYTIPVGMRRKVDIVYFSRVDDATLSTYSRALSIPKNKFKMICEEYLKDQHDFITVDLSGHPVQLRHNIFTPIPLHV